MWNVVVYILVATIVTIKIVKQEEFNSIWLDVFIDGDQNISAVIYSDIK